MYRHWLKLCTANLFLVLIFCAPQQGLASDTLLISPAFQEAQISNANPEAKLHVTVSNFSQHPQQMQLRISDLNPSGGKSLIDTGSPGSISSWAHLDQNTLMLGPNEQKSITLTLNNTPEISPGGHYGAVSLFTSSAEDSIQASSVTVTQAISSLLLVTKLDGARYGLRLADVDQKKFALSFPRTVILHFANTGNVHLVPRGTVSIMRRGDTVARGIINPDSTRIFPESTGDIPAQIYALKPVLAGRYDVNISYRYDGQEKPTVVTYQAFFFPSKLVLLIVLVILISLSLVFGWSFSRLYVAKARR